jgi:hypothetical protein
MRRFLSGMEESILPTTFSSTIPNAGMAKRVQVSQ